MKFGTQDVDAIKVGGSAVAAVYHGSQLAWSASRTVYFIADLSNDWGGSNWWADEQSSAPASPPTAADHVVLVSPCTENTTGSAPTVASLTVAFGSYITITATVTGTATFESASQNYGILNATAVFNNATNSGIVVGNATFSVASTNAGHVEGVATYTGTSNAADGSSAQSSIFLGDSTAGCGAILNLASWESSQPAPSYGCTDSSAYNYNDTATCEDWSCCSPEAYSEFVDCSHCSFGFFNMYDSCGNFEYNFVAIAFECDYLC